MLVVADVLICEVSNWVIYKLTPEEIAWERENFDLEAFMAGLREVEQTGGLKFEDFIGELEEIINRRE
jgi:hypothetical protein